MSAIHQHIDVNTSIVSQRLLEVNGAVYVLLRQFSMSLQTQVFSPCFGDPGLDDEEEDKSGMTSPPYNTFSDSNNNPTPSESPGFKNSLGLHLFSP